MLEVAPIVWRPMEALVDAVGDGVVMLLVGVTSPSAVATPPRSVLAMAQMFCIPLKTDGRSAWGALSTSVWLVCSKLIKRQTYLRQEE